jgi:hypothetical protein
MRLIAASLDSAYRATGVCKRLPASGHRDQRLVHEYVPPIPGLDTEGSRPSLFAFVDSEGLVEFRRIDELMADCLDAWRAFCSGFL